MGLQRLYQHMKGMRKYIIVSAIIFVFGIILGCTNRYEEVIRSTLGNMADLTKAAEQWPNYHLGLFSLLLLNNISALGSVLYGGVFLGILPIYFLIINGMAVGFSGIQEAANGSVWAYLLQILPSGIFEWPAMIMASAYGIRFGFLLLDGLISLPSEKGRMRVKADLIGFVRVLVPLMGVLLVLLAVGTVMETFVSP